MEKIKVKCRRCRRCLFCYTRIEDDNSVVVQNVSLKCDRCKRIVCLKKYTEKTLMQSVIDNTLLV